MKGIRFRQNDRGKKKREVEKQKRTTPQPFRGDILFPAVII